MYHWISIWYFVSYEHYVTVGIAKANIVKFNSEQGAILQNISLFSRILIFLAI